MTQSLGGLYSALRLPWAYSALQRVIARKDARRVFVDRYVQPRAGDRVIDIGCGPGAMLDYLGEVDYVGLDLDPNYIRSASRRYGNRGRFIHGDAANIVDHIDAQADIVLAVALLHHLDDAQARSLFSAAAKFLVPGGRLVTLDCVWTVPQNPIARFLIAADRGKNTRTSAAYSALAHESFSTVEVHLRDDLLRLPYDHCIMVCRKLESAAAVR
ncbi:MAG TPA: class I SAM-dependent methyltransferase [Pseudolabrys sp.]|nr:class I SAM-dependent methyltransferase [Pseudolabrys sp.]